MSQNILVDEIGYLPKDPKRAIYRGEGEVSFQVISKESGKEVFSGVSGWEIVCSAADEKNRVLNFDALTEEGEYFIKVGEE